ncbi:MAG: RNA-binding transcriptional accessory protein [Verrucomicrobiae bacterium]|nr:RNA-binding transcriptional accessory protein [Verrucomicrobiae bacterium]NNJ44260.1 RNA-binding transcriptional accessory protein [Akkermansiaceae bacterium]
MSHPDLSHVFVARISTELSLNTQHVAATAKMFSEGATVPFIARYRKEVTGGMDEVQITHVRDRLVQLADLEKRRDVIVKSLDERKLLTDALKKKIAGAETMTRLEDIFAPYRPKRRTRATMAKDRGLEPLANFIWENRESTTADPAAEAEKFIIKSEDKDQSVPLGVDALAGARDIIAERFSDDADARAELRELIVNDGTVTSKVMYGKDTETDAQKFKDYFEWSEPFATVPSHRMLAMRRGEKEGFLFMRIQADEERALAMMRGRFGVTNSGPCAEQVDLTITDSYKRLLGLSLETECRMKAKKDADVEAVRVFAENLRELLLASPLGQRSMIAIDPAFRTGCKTVVLDAQGNLIFDTVLHLTTSHAQAMEAASILQKMVEKFNIEAVAIGNGTASREAEAVVRACGLPKSVAIVIVNESGASIYSASEVAREEFPDKDITVRGAVSIGRRLMDPLAELVKLDPKSIGVGQYQHDVDQNLLKTGLDDTVVSCVNGVGVEVNTASRQLLGYVAGLNAGIATNIIAYRNENGPFKTRDELKKVPRLGDVAYEQAAGFLRILGGAHPLDASAVHPERYALVEQMAADLGCDVPTLIRDAGARKKIDLKKYVCDEVGLPTLKDIIAELAKPGRDPRAQFELFTFAEGVNKPSDLTAGIKLPGIVTNVTNFGAFVDVGVHQDGLVHISQLADQYVSDPSEVVKVGQKVQVTVTEVDLNRNRIALSMRANPDVGGQGARRESNRGGGPRNSNARSNHNGGGQQRQRGGGGKNEQLGGNWFDQALKKGR